MALKVRTNEGISHSLALGPHLTSTAHGALEAWWCVDSQSTSRQYGTLIVTPIDLVRIFPGCSVEISHTLKLDSRTSLYLLY